MKFPFRNIQVQLVWYMYYLSFENFSFSIEWFIINCVKVVCTWKIFVPQSFTSLHIAKLTFLTLGIVWFYAKTMQYNFHQNTIFFKDLKLLFKYHLVMSAGYACILKILFQKYKIHSVQHYFFKHAHVLKWHISWAITKINISMEEIVREFRDKRNLKLLWVKKWKNGEIKYVLIAWLPQGKNHNFLNISSNTSTSSRPVNNFSISSKLLQS